jgi:hypothetical protein
MYLCAAMKIHVNWQALGVSAAVACAIHCALLPLFLSSLPLLGINILNNVFFEAGMIALAIGIGSYSLSHGYRRHHHSPYPLVVFFAGMMILILAQFFASHHIGLLLAAFLFIMAAHFLNWKLCRRAKHCHATDCNH